VGIPMLSSRNGSSVAEDETVREVAVRHWPAVLFAKSLRRSGEVALSTLMLLRTSRAESRPTRPRAGRVRVKAQGKHRGDLQLVLDRLEVKAFMLKPAPGGDT
jgi:hypothetical protein